VTGFKLRSEIWDVRIIAAGTGVRVRAKLRKAYGRGRWRKLKGTAMVELPNGQVATAELHWYEAHGVGRRDMKVKRLLELHG
jgi:hypothetical protein